MTLKEIVTQVDYCVDLMTRQAVGPGSEGIADDQIRLRRAAYLLGGIRRELNAMAEVAEVAEVIAPLAGDAPPASDEARQPYRHLL